MWGPACLLVAPAGSNPCLPPPVLHCSASLGHYASWARRSAGNGEACEARELEEVMEAAAESSLSESRPGSTSSLWALCSQRLASAAAQVSAQMTLGVHTRCRSCQALCPVRHAAGLMSVLQCIKGVESHTDACLTLYTRGFHTC